MTFDEAALTVARAVFAASPNMTVKAFHQRITSLVVRQDDDDYQPMTVDQWRNHSFLAPGRVDPPDVVLTVASGDAFGG